MIINDNHICVFGPVYALDRITTALGDNYDDKYKALSHVCGHISIDLVDEPPLTELKTGDKFNYRERSYHKYPSNVAVLVEKNGVFGLQTFSDSKVGEFYPDILNQYQEVSEFFRKANDDIIVLENTGGRALSKSFDMLISYISKVLEARRNFEENKEYMDSYMEKMATLFYEAKYHPDFDMGTVFHKLKRESREFLLEMTNIAKRANSVLHKEYEKMYRFPDDKEQNCIAFGLYWGSLRTLDDEYVDFHWYELKTELLREMYYFIREHEGIVDDYCRYMDFPPCEANALKQLITKEGLLRDRWIFAADDLL